MMPFDYYSVAQIRYQEMVASVPATHGPRQRLTRLRGRQPSGRPSFAMLLRGWLNMPSRLNPLLPTAHPHR
jgi:hypothetical protein